MQTLPPVDRIQGAVLRPGRTHKESAVLLQYTDHRQAEYELVIPFFDAIYLLNVLREVERQSGFEGFLNNPRK